MANQGILRVLRDLQQLEESDQLAMTVHYEESNVRDIAALILGPPGTPYAFGFYQFSISIPTDYPASPPQVRLKTTNRGRTRFGPNLYASGKVCLSILGTWRGTRGEEWSPAQGLESVLLSIQSLLSANPYVLEPGYEEANRPSDQKHMQQYKSKIHHENLRLAVVAQLETAIGIINHDSSPPRPLNRPSSPEEGVSSPDECNDPAAEEKTLGPFSDYCKQRFLWYLDQYKKAIEDGIKNEPKNHGKSFGYQPFEGTGNGMMGQWNYPELKDRVQKLEELLMEETHEWPAQGLILEKKEAGIAVSLRAQHEQIVAETAQRNAATVDLTLVDDNPFLWLLTYFGRPMTRFDGGILKIKIYISPNHPIEQPRVFLETPLYHVRVTTQKMLVYLPAGAEEMRRHIESIIDALEEEDPPYNPLMVVNLEASKLCWGSQEEQRQYNRKLRRSVEESAK